MVRSSVLEKSCFLHRCSLNTFTCTPESVGLCMDDATVELWEIKLYCQFVCSPVTQKSPKASNHWLYINMVWVWHLASFSFTELPSTLLMLSSDNLTSMKVSLTMEFRMAFARSDVPEGSCVVLSMKETDLQVVLSWEKRSGKTSPGKCIGTIKQHSSLENKELRQDNIIPALHSFNK